MPSKDLSRPDAEPARHDITSTTRTWPLDDMIFRLAAEPAPSPPLPHRRPPAPVDPDRRARRLGLPRIHLSLTPPDPRLKSILPPEICLHYDCLPWKREGDRLWIATARPERFDRTARLIRERLRGAQLEILPVITTRTELQAEIARLHRAALSERMRSRVPLPLSCRRWPATSHGRLAGCLIGVALAVAATLAAPELVMTSLILVALATMLIAAGLKTTAAVAHLTAHRRPSEPLPEDELPAVTILAPLYREKQIATHLVARLNRLDYPRNRLEVLLILEEEDHVTRDTLARTDLPPWMRVIMVPDGAPRTKPRAMNYALDFAGGDIIGVYDAEDAPDPAQLKQVAAAFARAPEDVVCLQGVLDYYNPRASWIARCFTIEYSTWFRLVLPGMARLGFALPLGGTTLFFRRAPLEEIGAWDAHNVTEDADLGFRLARAGYRTQVIDTTTGEEANHRALPWIRQRSRWLKGYMATYLVHMRNPLRLLSDLGAWKFLGFQAHFVTALAQFALSPLLWIFWMVTLGIDMPYTTLDTNPWIQGLALAFLGQEALTMGLGVIASRRAGHDRLWAWVPLMHLYWPLGAVAMWKALYELVFKPFYWDKTAHGHSLTPAQPTVPIPPESSFSRVTKAREI